MGIRHQSVAVKGISTFFQYDKYCSFLKYTKCIWMNTKKRQTSFDSIFFSVFIYIMGMGEWVGEFMVFI